DRLCHLGGRRVPPDRWDALALAPGATVRDPHHPHAERRPLDAVPAHHAERAALHDAAHRPTGLAVVGVGGANDDDNAISPLAHAATRRLAPGRRRGQSVETAAVRILA